VTYLHQEDCSGPLVNAYFSANISDCPNVACSTVTIGGVNMGRSAFCTAGFNAQPYYEVFKYYNASCTSVTGDLKAVLPYACIPTPGGSLSHNCTAQRSFSDPFCMQPTTTTPLSAGVCTGSTLCFLDPCCSFFVWGEGGGRIISDAITNILNSFSIFFLFFVQVALRLRARCTIIQVYLAFSTCLCTRRSIAALPRCSLS
jgi:hypothetical protein